MNDFEARLLDMIAEQNETLKRLEAATVELGKTVGGLARALADQTRPNVINLTRKVRGLEGEVSELRGKVVRLDAFVHRAAGGSDAG